MRTIVTGGAGFIGSHIVDRLVKDKHHVLVIDDLSTGTEDNLKHHLYPDPTRIGLFRQDITTWDNLENYGKMHAEGDDKIDVIFHVAARASIPNSLKDPFGTNTQNVGGMIKVLELARLTGAKVVFSSSSSIYGDVQTPYSVQKAMCEQYMELYWRLYGVKSVALRYFNVYGERQPNTSAYALAIQIFLDQYKKGEPFTIVGDGKQRRDFIYVGDVVEANIQAIDAAKGFSVFDVGWGTNISINEVVDMISTQHPRVPIPPRIEPFENRAHQSMVIPGWNPTVTLQQWLQSQVSS